jgi:hypothetical protein
MAEKAGKTKPKQEQPCYAISREPLGVDIDPALINSETFRDVMFKPEGYYKPYAIGKEDPPEDHVDSTPHGRSIIDRKQIIKPAEVDEHGNVLDGIDRVDIGRRHGIACPFVRVKGLREDQKRDYITEVNTARRNLDARVRDGLAVRYMVREEVEYKAGKIAYRSTINKVAVVCGITFRRARQLERANFSDSRWKAACAGETRVTQNGKTYEVREVDPDSQINGLLGKLTGDTPLDQTEAAITALRELLEKYGDMLGDKERKDLRDQVDAADQRLRQRRAAEEQARATTDQASDSDASGGGDRGGGPAANKEKVGGDAPVAWFDRFRAELQEEIEAIEDTVLSLREWAGREEHPLSAALLRVLISAELIAVEEDQGEEVVRVDEPDLVAALASAEKALDPIFRRLGVTPEIAARHLLAMVREGRGLSLEPPASSRKATRAAGMS